MRNVLRIKTTYRMQIYGRGREKTKSEKRIIKRHRIRCNTIKNYLFLLPVGYA